MAESNVKEQVTAVETSDRGLFDFMKKKKNDEEEVLVVEQPTQNEHAAALDTEFEHKVQVSKTAWEKEEQKDHEEKKSAAGGLLDKFHRDDHSSSSSSSDEEGDDEEKKKRRKERKEKKGLKEKLKEKLPGHKDEDDTNVPIEKYEEIDSKPHVQEVVYSEPSHVTNETDHEKKGFLDKIKDKLPGHPKPEEHHVSAAPMAAEPCVEAEGKKGFLDKIKDKLPGFSSKSSEDKKEDH
ncbi:hypothetical protein vseg_017884 [Gypsophila vaccaria]